MNRNRLLITGASGFLGWWLCREADMKWHVHALCNANPCGIPGIASHRWNLGDSGGLGALFERIRPDAVIHAAAVAATDRCQRFPQESRPINVDAPRELAILCARDRIPMVFTSTDLVFDGRNAPYTESDPPSPVNVYGAQKAAAEAEVLSAYPDATVCRLPLLFGFSGGIRTGFDRAIVNALRRGETVPLFRDEFRTPADPISVARGLLLAVSGIRGVCHLGGRARLSRYDMGRRLAAVFGLDAALLIPAKQASATSVAPRAADVSLVSDRAYAMGYDPMDMADAYRAMADALGFLP